MAVSTHTHTHKCGKCCRVMTSSWPRCFHTERHRCEKTNLKSLQHSYTTSYTRKLRQHGGCLWPGAYLAPGHLQASWKLWPGNTAWCLHNRFRKMMSHAFCQNDRPIGAGVKYTFPKKIKYTFQSNTNTLLFPYNSNTPSERNQLQIRIWPQAWDPSTHNSINYYKSVFEITNRSRLK